MSAPGTRHDREREPSRTASHLTSMRMRRLSVLLVVAVCSLSLAACDTTHAGTTQAATTARSSRHPSHSQLLPGCGGPVPPRHAWATEVSVNGHVRWQVPLPTFGNNPLTESSPVTGGNIALFDPECDVQPLHLSHRHIPLTYSVLHT